MEHWWHVRSLRWSNSPSTLQVLQLHTDTDTDTDTDTNTDTDKARKRQSYIHKYRTKDRDTCEVETSWDMDPSRVFIVLIMEIRSNDGIGTTDSNYDSMWIVSSLVRHRTRLPVRLPVAFLALFAAIPHALAP